MLTAKTSPKIYFSVFGATITALIVWLHGPQFGVCWFAWPMLLVAPTTLSTLQIGNAHFFIVCSSILAMVCFETRRVKLGGVLLGFAVLSKVFPGLLLVYLMARRRWSNVGWTIAAMFAMCVATLATFGAQPYSAFVSYQLPRIASDLSAPRLIHYSLLFKDVNDDGYQKERD